MKTQRRNSLVATGTLLLLYSNIYLTLWVSGFHDTDRRWILWVSLFGFVAAQALAVEMMFRVPSATDANVMEAKLSGGRILYVVGSMTGMLAIGLFLRFTM